MWHALTLAGTVQTIATWMVCMGHDPGWLLAQTRGRGHPLTFFQGTARLDQGNLPAKLVNLHTAPCLRSPPHQISQIVVLPTVFFRHPLCVYTLDIHRLQIEHQLKRRP